MNTREYKWGVALGSVRGAIDAWRADAPLTDGEISAVIDAADEFVAWVELYGHPEEWVKRAQAAHARAERAEAKLRSREGVREDEGGRGCSVAWLHAKEGLG